MQAQLIR